ncbi:MAG: hypothetical protein E8D46_10480 [Nitrospira sp.]|nr:MAG: hypothetical protein E8D46_10480 [Nitrospira sp.]
MIGIEELHYRLKDSIEANYDILKYGELFLPKYLEGKTFVNQFKLVMATLAEKIDLKLRREVRNEFPSEYKMSYQCVDYVFNTKKGQPILFLELESLDRSQLYLFSDGPVNEKDNNNKLWYYHATLSNYYSKGTPIPRYFIFLLILPDRKVGGYTLWDINKNYQFFDPALRETIHNNPYRFYDRQIKACARALLRNEKYFWDGNDWSERPLEEIHKRCELIFLTCTIDRLILSRGKDLFDPAKEVALPIEWTDSLSSKEGKL